MNARTILKLIATQDYDELKRLALAEVCEKDEFSEGIVLPTRIFDTDEEKNRYFLIAEWGE